MSKSVEAINGVTISQSTDDMLQFTFAAKSPIPDSPFTLTLNVGPEGDFQDIVLCPLIYQSKMTAVTKRALRKQDVQYLLREVQAMVDGHWTRAQALLAVTAHVAQLGFTLDCSADSEEAILTAELLPGYVLSCSMLLGCEFPNPGSVLVVKDLSVTDPALTAALQPSVAQLNLQIAQGELPADPAVLAGELKRTVVALGVQWPGSEQEIKEVPVEQPVQEEVNEVLTEMVNQVGENQEEMVMDSVVDEITPEEVASVAVEESENGNDVEME